MKRMFKVAIASMSIVLGALAPSSAQELPDRIRIIVPFPAGGPTDVLARFIAQGLSENLKTTFIVENYGGANGTIGANQVARAEPNGATLLFHATHQAVTPALFKNIPYNTEKDFSAIALAATVPNALVVNSEFPAKTLAEFIAMAKKEPGKYSFGSFGGANQLAGELFKRMAGIDIKAVLYKGSAPAMNDVLGGHIPMMFDSLPTTLPFAQDGKVRVLGVTSKERSKSLPDVPTIAEAGNLPGYEANAWFALFMPAGGKPEIRQKLCKAMSEVLATEAIRTKFDSLGAVPGNLTCDKFQAFFLDEVKKWRAVAEETGITPQ